MNSKFLGKKLSFKVKDSSAKVSNYFNGRNEIQTNIIHLEQLLVLLSYRVFGLPEYLQKDLAIILR